MKTITDLIKERNLMNEGLKETSSFTMINNAVADAVKECIGTNLEIFDKGLEAFYNKNDKLRAEVDDEIVDIINEYLSEHYKLEENIDASILLPIILGWTLYFRGKKK